MGMYDWATQSFVGAVGLSPNEPVSRTLYGHTRCQYRRVPGGGSLKLLEDRTLGFNKYADNSHLSASDCCSISQNDRETVWARKASVLYAIN